MCGGGKKCIQDLSKNFDARNPLTDLNCTLEANTEMDLILISLGTVLKWRCMIGIIHWLLYPNTHCIGDWMCPTLPVPGIVPRTYDTFV
jgi:hypothetical protein